MRSWPSVAWTAGQRIPASMLKQPPSGTASTTHSAQDPLRSALLLGLPGSLAVLLDEQAPHLLGALRGLGIAL
jgi:hypothetical protein